MNELGQLTEACVRLGASQAQAETMAAQLLKRAGQIAQARGVTREVALEYLLRLVVQGRAGEAPLKTHPPASPSRGDGK
jgi:phage-related minor tail protein